MLCIWYGIYMLMMVFYTFTIYDYIISVHLGKFNNQWSQDKIS